MSMKLFLGVSEKHEHTGTWVWFSEMSSYQLEEMLFVTLDDESGAYIDHDHDIHSQIVNRQCPTKGFAPQISNIPAFSLQHT